jgi:2-hydroxychromene-2-carboxylate isomerase
VADESISDAARKAGLSEDEISAYLAAIGTDSIKEALKDSVAEAMDKGVSFHSHAWYPIVY